ncbi:MAG: mismatch repair ATPase (MutS family), partial [uncultured archaeon A07HR60]
GKSDRRTGCLRVAGGTRARNDWVRPEITDPGPLEIEAGRHPVVEATTEFVPNDLRMDPDRGFLIVTGPNMSGKSTYLRQAALITLLAQIGSFVPARAARVGLVDGIYTRVGALDELAGGRSTFMVEMQELSKILHAASEESLVILDEVGRGTATYDGISIAWAATEYLHNQIRAKTLFATHYHELTSLADHLPRVENVHVAADETDGNVTFLRTIRDGPTDRSYGIHVADLAGVPGPVVSRGEGVLQRLREEKAIEARGGDESGGSEQVVFDLSSGSLRADESSAADGGTPTPEKGPTDSSDGVVEAADTDGETGVSSVTNNDETATATPTHPEIDEDAMDVLEDLQAVDVNETAPVELLTMVREWQRRVD